MDLRDFFDFTETLTGKSRLEPEFYKHLKIGAEGLILIQQMDRASWKGLFKDENWMDFDKRYLKLAFLLGREGRDFETLCRHLGIEEEAMLLLLFEIAS
jgi:hypothetical protein